MYRFNTFLNIFEKIEYVFMFLDQISILVQCLSNLFSNYKSFKIYSVV